MKVSDYAKHSVIDMPTVIGMRLAVYRAIIAWHKSADKTYDNALRIIKRECLDDNLLESAATHNIVANFYTQLLTTAGQDAVIEFLNSAPKSAAEGAIKSYNMQPVLGCARWVKNSLPMSGAFTKILGQSTLTEAFLDYTRTPNILNDQTELSNHYQLTEFQIAYVERGTKMMRMGDKLSKPNIAFLWADFSPQAERATTSPEELWKSRLAPCKNRGIEI